jgi:hypothetical protein
VEKPIIPVRQTRCLQSFVHSQEHMRIHRYTFARLHHYTVQNLRRVCHIMPDVVSNRLAKSESA